MTSEEFRQIQHILYGAYGILRDNAELDVWFKSLKEFPFADAKDAVNDYVTLESKKPTIADIIARIEDVMRWKQQRPDLYKADPNVKTYKCPVCKDLGFVEFETPTGVTLSRPCQKCEAGKRTAYQWSDEGMAEWISAEHAKGRHPGKPVYASKEFAMSYNYGIKI